MAEIIDGWSPKNFHPKVVTYDRIGKRRFGIELEYTGLPESDYEGATIFGGKEDGSVTDGGEFDSPILYGDQGLKVCEDFCEFAENEGFGTGLSAGYHLHLDVTNEPIENIKRIALGYHYTKDFWFSVIPSHRRTNSYCSRHPYRRNSVLGWQNENSFLDYLASLDRYSWFNLYAYYRHKTLEIRCHEASYSDTDVVNWILAHQRFFDEISSVSIGRITRIFARKPVDTLEREIKQVIQHEGVNEHLAKRRRLFAEESV